MFTVWFWLADWRERVLSIGAFWLRFIAVCACWIRKRQEF
jgi:hypothetical protein